MKPFPPQALGPKKTELPNGDVSYTHVLETVCAVLHKHVHSVSHWMTVASGEALVRSYQDEYSNIITLERTARPGDPPLDIEAGIYHDWKALVPNTQVVCTFPGGIMQINKG